MENNKLTQIWKSQKNDVRLEASDSIIKKAEKQRNSQFVTIGILSVTLIIVIAYAFAYASNNWNDFTLGLILMISSLFVRIVIEYITIYRKKSRLILLDNRSFQKYLQKHYKIRLRVNYIITPICFGIYVWGFIKLLPYFKNMFSKGFYIYIIISGIAVLVVLSVIIIRVILKEQKFLKQFSKQ